MRRVSAAQRTALYIDPGAQNNGHTFLKTFFAKRASDLFKQNRIKTANHCAGGGKTGYRNAKIPG
jgi:hypothetical protein